jgi:hypothetical protein
MIYGLANPQVALAAGVDLAVICPSGGSSEPSLQDPQTGSTAVNIWRSWGAKRPRNSAVNVLSVQKATVDNELKDGRERGIPMREKL